MVKYTYNFETEKLDIINTADDFVLDFVRLDNTSWLTLTNDSMADSLHRHSELSASDGSPNPVVSVSADGLIRFSNATNHIYISGTNPNTLNCYNVDNADGRGFYINYRGYADGFTRSRDFYIADGKSNVFFSAIGATQQIGIGNTPQSKLDVSGRIIQRATATNSISTYFQTNGDAQASSTNLNPGILLWQSANDAYGIDLGYSSTSTGNYGVRAFFPSNREFAVASYVANTLPTAQSGFTYHMVVEGDGKVGIGTATPNRNLETNGTGNVVNRITGDDAFLELRDKSTNNQMSLQFTDGNNLQIRYGAGLGATAYSTTDLVSFKPDGNVGILTTTPRQALDVAGIVTASNYYIRSGDNTYSGRLVDGGTYLTLDAYNGADWNSRNMRIQGNEIYFLDGATTEVARIKSGKFGIKTADPGATLDVSGNAIVTGSMSIGSVFTQTIYTSGTNLMINTGSGYTTTISGNLTVLGNTYIKMPYAMFSSTETQVGSPINTSLPITFNTVEDVHQMSISGGSVINFQQAGDYLINISAIAQNTSPTAGRIQIWPCKNGSDIPRSNTIYDFKGQNTYAVISVPFILDIASGNTFCMRYASSNTGVEMTYTGSTAYSPSTPSIIMTINKISEITP